MEIIWIILSIGGIGAILCIIGMIRNWNSKSEDDAGSQVHLTLVGCLLAFVTVASVIGLIVYLWMQGMPLHRGRLGRNAAVAIGLIAGLLIFFIPAAILHAFGIRCWRSETSQKKGASAPKPKKLRYRLGDKEE